MKLKVYIMHSEKVDYVNEIYRPLLKIGLMKEYYLILPLSDRYKNTYIKDLYKDSDIIICDLTKSNFFLKMEINTAKKLNKKIYYFINCNDKNVNKYKNLELNKYTDKEEFCLILKKLLDSLNKKQILLEKDNIYPLGKIIRK